MKDILKTIGFIGCGNMGGALIKKIAKNGAVYVYDSDEAKANACVKIYGTTRAISALELAQKCNAVVAAVKPQQLAELLSSIRDALADKVLISIAAGVTLTRLAELAPKARIIRVMPNTPVQVGEGAIAWTAAANVRAEERAAFVKLFSPCGLLFPLEEKLMDAFTALAGSGPAYVFTLINALAEGGVHEGLNKNDALRMTAQTFLGSARMLLELGEHPEVLKDRVTSPGGTTMAGLAALETGAVRSACIQAVAAARARAEELGK
ncbi:MAG: pyrroline-5-carboxylate reductase [Spirochaetota bacterium]|jgi:pyrroline-5-carboxylate reductase|nr:pyrroline-5-carboxylate reductase [Spirochaetota bacterium]